MRQPFVPPPARQRETEFLPSRPSFSSHRPGLQRIPTCRTCCPFASARAVWLRTCVYTQSIHGRCLVPRRGLGVPVPSHRSAPALHESGTAHTCPPPCTGSSCTGTSAAGPQCVRFYSWDGERGWRARGSRAVIVHLPAVGSPRGGRAPALDRSRRLKVTLPRAVLRRLLLLPSRAACRNLRGLLLLCWSTYHRSRARAKKTRRALPRPRVRCVRHAWYKRGTAVAAHSGLSDQIVHPQQLGAGSASTEHTRRLQQTRARPEAETSRRFGGRSGEQPREGGGGRWTTY